MRTTKLSFATPATIPFILSILNALAQPNQDIEKDILNLFQQRCSECHGLKQTKFSKPKKPQLDAATDLLALRNTTKYIISGSATNSLLFSRVTLPKDDEERMPQSTDKDPRDPLTADQVALVKKWIEPGNLVHRPFISDQAVIELIKQDLLAASETNRIYIRYLTLHNLFNSGDSGANLEIYRAALNKLVNSLSGEDKIVRLRPIDPNQVVLRLDLRNYFWTGDRWDELVKGYPYAIIRGLRIEKEVAAMSGTPLAYLRGDWFVFATSQPPLYNFFQVLESDRKLEEIYGINITENIHNGTAKRAGFAVSGVSQYNRMIERHPIPDGGAKGEPTTDSWYWKSYDFKSADGKQNLFANPLGPAGLGNHLAFEHNGGEIILGKDNGLQSYMLVTAKGDRLNRAPTEIVNDPSRPDSAIINGISCMKCHAEGLRLAPKGSIDDELRPAALKALDLTPEDEQMLKAIYPEPSVMRALYEKDVKKFKEALNKCGAGTSPEPISFLYDRFLSPVTVGNFASEFGLESPDILKRLIESDVKDLRVIGARLEQAGSFSRKSFIDQFQQTVEGLSLGKLRKFEPVRYEEFFPSEGNPSPTPDRKTGPDPSAEPLPHAPKATSNETLQRQAVSKFVDQLSALIDQVGLSRTVGVIGSGTFLLSQRVEYFPESNQFALLWTTSGSRPSDKQMTERFSLDLSIVDPSRIRVQEVAIGADQGFYMNIGFGASIVDEDKSFNGNSAKSKHDTLTFEVRGGKIQRNEIERLFREIVKAGAGQH